jgi:DNA-binding response OmpR family regulator
MLTARDQLEDRLRGFDVGADDYLIKPFALRELLARLSAITRRAAPTALPRRLLVDDVVLDQRAREVYRAGVSVHLTPKEYAVLELLMENAGAVVSRDTIMRRVWEYDFDGDSNVLETVIKRLRRSIDTGRANPLISTARGVGYKVKAPAPKS